MRLCRTFFAVFFLFFPLMASATGQVPERIYIDGEKWNFFDLPLEYDEEISRKVQQALPMDGWFNTGCVREYVGEWELKENRLYLRGIERLDGKYINADTLKQIFAPYCTGEGILASWVVAGGLRAGRGEALAWSDEWSECIYEQECIFSIDHGVLTAKRVHDNYIRQGVSLDTIYDTVNRYFPWMLFPEVSEEFVELHVGNLVIDSNAAFVDCNLKISEGNVMIDSQDDPRIVAVKRILGRISPWTTLHVNGRVETYAYNIRADNRENTVKSIREVVSAIYDEVETTIREGRFDSSLLVRKHCTYIFRSVYSEAHAKAAEKGREAIRFCHWTRGDTCVNPVFRICSVGAVTQKKDDFRKVIVFMEKNDTIDGKPVVQPFAVRMVHAGRWQIEDFQNAHMPTDRRIMNNNLKKMNAENEE